VTYGPEEASCDFTLLSEGAASFEVRAQLEHHLLDLLRAQGTEAVTAFLQALPEHDFRLALEGTSEPEARYVTAGPGSSRLIVETFLGPDHASVNVTEEDESSEPPAPHPRHRKFHEVWESLLGIPNSAVAELDPERRAVFLVGLLVLARTHPQRTWAVQRSSRARAV
jgi:hypothetical protein